MTLTEWRDNLEILGPDLTAWPPRLAEAGMALMEASELAQDMFVVASGAGPSSERSHARPDTPG